jgi:hypothetical protein
MEVQTPVPDDATENVKPVADEYETTLREVRAFLDDPVALLERAAFLLRKAQERTALVIVGVFPEWRNVLGAIGAAYFTLNGHDQWAYWLGDHVPGFAGALLSAVAIQVLP